MSVLIVATLLLCGMFFFQNAKIRLSITSIVLLGILIKLLGTTYFVYVVNHDTEFRREVGTKILAGENMYYDPSTGHYSTFYLPPFHYIDALALAAEKQFGIPQMGLLKVFFSVFDVGIIVILAKMIQDKGKTALLYALNPISFLITTVHGQSDILAAFFLLLSAYFINNKKEGNAYTAFMLGVLAKTWPVIFIFPLLKRAQHKTIFILIVAAGVTAAVVGYSLWYNVSLYQIARPMMTYRGIIGTWGITSIIFFAYRDYSPLILKAFKILSTLFLVGFSYFSLKLKRQSLTEELFLIILFFFVFSLGFGAQWTTWIVPFMLIQRPPLWRTALTLLTIWIALSEAPWVMETVWWIEPILLPTIKIVGIAAWFSLILMLTKILTIQKNVK